MTTAKNVLMEARRKSRLLKEHKALLHVLSGAESINTAMTINRGKLVATHDKHLYAPRDSLTISRAITIATCESLKTLEMNVFLAGSQPVQGIR
jgi:hypothetical protein